MFHVAFQTYCCGEHVAVCSHVAHTFASRALDIREEGAAIAVRASEVAMTPGKTAAMVGITWSAAAAIVLAVKASVRPISVPITGSTTTRGQVTT